MSPYSQEQLPVDFHQVPSDFPQAGTEFGGSAPYEVGIEGAEFGQDPVASLEPAAPSLASRVGDRMSQIGGIVSEAAQAVGDRLQDPRFQQLARAAGEGALMGVGVASRAEDGRLQISTGKAMVAVRAAKSLTPMGVAAVTAKAAWGGYKEVQAARDRLTDVYANP